MKTGGCTHRGLPNNSVVMNSGNKSINAAKKRFHKTCSVWKQPAFVLTMVLLTIVLLTTLSFPTDPVDNQKPADLVCDGKISHYVPAVVGDNGELVNVTMYLSPGSGETGQIYVTINPQVGVTTQESIETAVNYAYGFADMLGEKEQCNILVAFSPGRATSYIDGPSGGSALTAMTYALITNRTMRNDTIVTGTIETSGEVGAVGGLYEKAKSAASMGAKYFITPVENIYEMLLLRNMESQYGITILQAHNFQEVAGFLFDNKTIAQEQIATTKRKILDLPRYDASMFMEFKPLAGGMIEIEKAEINNLTSDGNETATIKDFFENEIKRQESILRQGYLFSAANEAFLNYIDVATIKVITTGKVDLPKKKGEAGICLTRIKRPNLTDNNFEWVVGSDLRQAWAYEKIQGVDPTEEMTLDEKYVKYNDLMYAQAWCAVAGGLISAAPAGGTGIDESSWKELASEKINQAKALSPKDEDLLLKISLAQASYQNGRYGAAIYDAVYVIANSQAPPKNLSGRDVDAVMNETRESLWGRIYQSHAAYLYAQNQTLGAYKAAIFARGLDEATGQMRTIVEKEEAHKTPGATEGSTSQDRLALEFRIKTMVDNVADNAGVLIAAIFLIFLLVVVVFDIVSVNNKRQHGTGSNTDKTCKVPSNCSELGLLGRKYGTNSARPGKTDGTKQKKGRT